MLYIKGTDGLGNRMLSLEYAARIAASWDVGLFVDWDDDLYAVDQDLFNDYFELRGVNHQSIFNFDTSKSPFPSNRNFFETKRIWRYVRRPMDVPLVPEYLAVWRRINRLSNRFVIRRQPWKSIPSGEHIRGYLKNHDLVLYLCPLPFREPEFFRHLLWRQDRIQRDLSSQGLISEVDIGIHVRNTDKRGVDFTRLSQILNRVIISLDDPLIHVATDSLEALNFIKSHCKGLRVQSLTIDRNEEPIHLRTANKEESIKQFKNAIWDMYLLSNAQHLVYQSNSSFSRIALSYGSAYRELHDLTPKSWG